MGRRRYIDRARGVAVLLMIEAHTLDAWTQAASRTGSAFAYASILGGFAAPLFLWLAGLAAVLSAASYSGRSDNRAAAVDAILRRGLQIFILAFLFRLQAFIVSPGGHLVTLFRVDILNVMGPALAVTGLVWAVSARPRRLVFAYAGLACAVAMVTPLVRVWPVVDTLPLWGQWYLRPSGDYTTFTLFPWAGFVFAGAACGVPLAYARDVKTEHRVETGFAVTGAALFALGFIAAARPSIFAQSSFWTSSPTYFAVRIGILMMALASFYALERAMEGRAQWLWLQRVGRSSLFIYWIHVELVYGYATWPLRRNLPLWGAVLAFVIFSALMYGAVVWRDRLVEGWRARRLESAASPVSS